MQNILLNFQSSHSGGGLKRLIEFSSYFNGRGGATFVIHPNSMAQLKCYSNNKYIIENPSNFKRIFNIPNFPKNSIVKNVRWDAYYSYGVPICKDVNAIKKILHVSNVLPFVVGRYGYGALEWLKFKLIFLQMLYSFRCCTHVSAESIYSLSLLRRWHNCIEIYSQNGSDDELNSNEIDVIKKQKNVIVLGTHKHKNLSESVRVFDGLSKSNRDLRLYVIGSVSAVPNYLKERSDIVFLGVMQRKEIINLLLGSYYYISTTEIENSFNAASEGIYFAEESYISKIPPHYELLEGIKFEEVLIPGATAGVLKVCRKNLNTQNLKCWKEVVESLFFVVDGVKHVH